MSGQMRYVESKDPMDLIPPEVGSDRFRKMLKFTDDSRYLGYHHNNYKVAVVCFVSIDGRAMIISSGNYKPEKGDDATRICAEAFLIDRINEMIENDHMVRVYHTFLCAEPRPEKDKNHSRFGARTPCDSCLEKIASCKGIGDDSLWTLHTPIEVSGHPKTCLTMTTEDLLRECRKQ